MTNKKTTVLDVKQAKTENRKLVMVTAYDYPFGKMAHEVGVDMVLVGDSLGMVVMGLDSTIEVTMEQIIHHTRAVVRGCKSPLVISDMPFMSYQVSEEKALENAGRLIKEGGCDAVKLEGGKEMAKTVRRIVTAGICVQGHIGLTPQSATALGGFKAQGKDMEAARRIIEDAKALEDAGVFSIVIESVPAPLGKKVAESVTVPVIGIGAGVDTDGQVLVSYDLIGLFDTFVPKFVKKYTNIRSVIMEAMTSYKKEVQNKEFPAPEHCFSMPEDIMKKLIG